MFKTILFSLFIGFIFNADTAHEFHLSNTQLKYKATKDVLQVSVRIFIDDLETALAEKNVTGLFIGTEKESEESAIHIVKYLNEVFQINADDTMLESEFIGKEVSEDLSSLWCHLQYNDVVDCTDLTITNSIFTEIFDDQKNIFTFSTEQGRKDYFTFDIADKVKTFTCE